MRIISGSVIAAVAVVIVAAPTAVLMGQAAPGRGGGGGSTAGVAPRPGDTAIKDLRRQIEPHVPTSQPRPHSDEIDILSWSWGETSLERHINKFPTPPEPAPTTQPGGGNIEYTWKIEEGEMAPAPSPNTQPGGSVPTEEVAFYFNKINWVPGWPSTASTQPGLGPTLITFTGLEGEPGDSDLTLAAGGLGAGDPLASQRAAPELKRRTLNLLALAAHMSPQRLTPIESTPRSQVDYFLKIDGVEGTSQPAQPDPTPVSVSMFKISSGQEPVPTTHPHGGGHAETSWKVEEGEGDVPNPDDPTCQAISEAVIDGRHLQSAPGEPPMVHLAFRDNRVAILNHAPARLAALRNAGIGDDHPIGQYVAQWRDVPTGMIDLQPPSGSPTVQAMIRAARDAPLPDANGRGLLIRSADGGGRPGTAAPPHPSVVLSVQRPAMRGGSGNRCALSLEYIDAAGETRTLHLLDAGDPDRPLITGHVLNPQ